MHDIGVGQQHVGSWRRLAERQREALLLGPGLAHPSGREGLSVYDRQPIGSTAHLCSTQRDRSGTITALVIDQNDRERAGVVLVEQRTDTFCNAVSLVASGDDRSHHRPWRTQVVTAVITYR